MAWGNLTLANFGRFFTAGSYKRALYNSILTSGGATLLAAALGVPMAFAGRRAVSTSPAARWCSPCRSSR